MPLFNRGIIFGQRGGALTQSHFVTAAEQESIVNVSSSLQSTDTTLRTVANGKILWITSAWVSAAWNTGNPGTDGTFESSISIATGGVIVGCVTSNNGSTSSPTIVNPLATASNSTTFPMPLKVLAGETVQLKVGSSAIRASGGFNGWEENA